MMAKLSNWLNCKARQQNLAEVKAALEELNSDPEFQEEFRNLNFRDRIAMARDMVNLQRGKYQEWRIWGVLLAALGTAIWTLGKWWLSR